MEEEATNILRSKNVRSRRVTELSNSSQVTTTQMTNREVEEERDEIVAIAMVTGILAEN